MKPQLRPLFTGAGGGVERLLAETDNISLQRIDEAAAVSRPGNLGTTYGEKEFDALRDEQAAAWPAEADVASREPRVKAASLEVAAEEAAFAVEVRHREVEQARDARNHVLETLTPFVRRAPHDDLRYWAGWVVLGLGDTVGVWGAAISLGEIPQLALGQAVATGFAALTAGLVGGEVRTFAQAKSRRRDPESLSPDEVRYRRLFEGAESEIAMTKVAAGTAGAVVTLITASIYALRASTEGGLTGIAFGCLAAATALASFISSYIHADEVADLIAQYDRRYRQALAAHGRASAAKPIAAFAAATAEADSITSEHEHRGDAARHKVEACKNRMLRRNPQVVGHGDATPDVVAITGATARKGLVA